MKSNWIIIPVLCVLLAFGFWLFHRPNKAVDPRAEKNGRPKVARLPHPAPVNVVKMNTISRELSLPQSRVSVSEKSNWSEVQTIVNPQAPYNQRLSAIYSLSTRLTDADWEILRQFLQKPDALDADQAGQVLKNQLMDILCVQNPPRMDLGNLLADIFHNRKQDEVIRDYAVQHLVAYYEQAAGQSGNARALEMPQKVLWEAVQEPASSIGGTALLALKRLSQEYSQGFDQKRIAATALQMASSPISKELTQITAYQVCAQLGVADALPVVLQAAQNGKSIPLKMSAIAAVGILGGQTEIPLLNTFLQGDEDRLKPVAQKALKQIVARQNQVVSQK